jgi:hypothetical protein
VQRIAQQNVAALQVIEQRAQQTFFVDSLFLRWTRRRVENRNAGQAQQGKQSDRDEMARETFALPQPVTFGTCDLPARARIFVACVHGVMSCAGWE